MSGPAMKMAVGPHFARGKLLLDQKRYGDAVKELRVACVSDLNDPVPPAYLSFAYSGLGNAPGANAAAREAIAREPNSPLGHLALGYACFIAGQVDAARDAGGESLRLQPSADAQVLLARLAAATEDWTQALTHADSALSRNPFDSRAALVRGRALIATGRTGEAIDTLRTALRSHPEDAELHGALGWALLHAGREADAFSHLRESLRLDPQSDQVRSRLAESLKSRNVIYRQFLRTALWFGRRRRAKATVFRTAIVLYLLLFAFAAAIEASIYFWLLGGFGLGLTLYMWQRLSVPVFDLFLQLDPLGRHLLTRRERTASWMVAACFLFAAALTVTALTAHYGLLFLAVANMTVVPWLLSFTVADASVMRRRIRFYLFIPSLLALDLGITLAALAELELLPEPIGGAGALAAMLGFFGVPVSGWLLVIPETE